MVLHVAKTYPGVMTPDELAGFDWGLKQSPTSTDETNTLVIVQRDGGSIYDGETEIQDYVSDLQDYVNNNPIDGDLDDWLDEYQDGLLDVRENNPIGLRFGAYLGAGGSIKTANLMYGGTRVPLSAAVFNGCQFSFVQLSLQGYGQTTLYSVVFKFKNYKTNGAKSVTELTTGGGNINPPYTLGYNDDIFYKFTVGQSTINKIRNLGSQYHLIGIQFNFYSDAQQNFSVYSVYDLRFGVKLNGPNPEQYRFTMPVTSDGNTLGDMVEFLYDPPSFEIPEPSNRFKISFSSKFTDSETVMISPFDFGVGYGNDLDGNPIIHNDSLPVSFSTSINGYIKYVTKGADGQRIEGVIPVTHRNNVNQDFTFYTLKNWLTDKDNFVEGEDIWIDLNFE